MRLTLALGLLTALTAVACNEPTASSQPAEPTLTADVTAEHTTTTELVDDIMISPCNGESIHFTGSFVEQLTLVGPDAGATHAELEDVFSGTGLGLTTGLSYSVQGAHHISFQSPTPEAFQTAYTERDRFSFNTSAPGLSFAATFLVHLVDLPSGEEKVTHEVESLECRA